MIRGLDYEALCGTSDPLRLILRGGGVRRYHTEPFELRQTVAEHSWRVTAILLALWPDASLELVRAALYHDTAEAVTGDLPAPSKRAMNRDQLDTMEDEFNRHVGIVFNLSRDERAKLKCADYLELVMTMAAQPDTVDVLRVYRNGDAYVREHADRLGIKDRARVLFFLDNVACK